MADSWAQVNIINKIITINWPDKNTHQSDSVYLDDLFTLASHHELENISNLFLILMSPGKEFLLQQSLHNNEKWPPVVQQC